MHTREDFFELLAMHKYPKQVYVKLFYMLSTNNNNYTPNSNGIFFNLHTIDDDVIHDATTYIRNIYNNIESYNKTIKYRQEQINIIQDALPLSQKKNNVPQVSTKPSMIYKTIKDPFTNIKYSGVHQRLDNILKGRVNTIVPDKKQKPHIEDASDDDLFGDEEENIEGDEEDNSDSDGNDSDLDIN